MFEEALEDNYFKYIDTLQKNIYANMQAVYNDISLNPRIVQRKCDKCGCREYAQFSYMTERMWICNTCKTRDIAHRVEKSFREAIASDAESLKEFLETIV